MSKYVRFVGWDDAPHLNPPHLPAEARAEFEATLTPAQREARKTGRPSLGAGAIYQVPESDLLIEPFEIPHHWWWAYGFDVGWNNTAMVKLRLDPDNDVAYIVGEYKDGGKQPAMHVASIKALIGWDDCPGACDPAANASNQRDGKSLLQEYRGLGLNLRNANNTVWAGITDVTHRMQTGRLKVFRTLTNWLNEFRLYRTEKRRTATGEQVVIVKKNDHLMDAMRYAVHTQGLFTARVSRTASFGRYGEF